MGNDYRIRKLAGGRGTGEGLSSPPCDLWSSSSDECSCDTFSYSKFGVASHVQEREGRGKEVIHLSSSLSVLVGS